MTAASLRCTKHCPGGHKCACNGRPHVLHMCSDRTCECHAARRYGLRLEAGEYVAANGHNADEALRVLEVEL